MPQNSNKTLLKNTIFLYARTLILLVLGLYTSRITMQALGVENYGIINVVSGFVSMFVLISGALTGASQRFITFELGKRDGNVRQIFSSAFFIQIALALIIVILAETVGLYFVNSKLNLPEEKMYEVQWVFQCSIISFVLNLINIPYNALIIAHEKMKAFAYISLLESFLKFATAYTILLLPQNVLILYSILTLTSSTLVRLAYQIYCLHSFKKEAKLEIVRNRSLFNLIFKFAGWSFVGNTAYILNGQGVNMVLNIFCGVTINAAKGISSIIENTVVSFINNFTMSLNPQITKSYALSDMDRFKSLIELGIKISFFLSVIMVLPLITSIENVLKYWLGIFPKETVAFSIIVLVITIFQALSNPLMTAVNATGNIKKYQLIIGGINILPLPLSYLLLYWGLPAVSVFVLALVFAIILFALRLIYVALITPINIHSIVLIICFRLIPSILISLFLCIVYKYTFPIENILGLFMHLISTCVIVVITSFLVITSHYEKQMIFHLIRNKLNVILRNK